MRLLVRTLPALLFIGATLWLLVGQNSVAAKSTGTVISGDDLPQSIRVPFVDNSLFWSMAPTPTLVDHAPSDFQPHYSLEGDYWALLRARTETPGKRGFDGPDFDATVRYDPVLGVVESTNGQDLAWLQLDAQRRELLDTYIALARTNVLPEAPNLMEVLQARSTIIGEPIAVEIAGHPLDDQGDDAGTFWRTIGSPSLAGIWADDFYDDPEDGTRRPDGKRIFYYSAVFYQPPQDFDLNFELASGRVISLRYRRDNGNLVDLSSLRDNSGTGYGILPGFVASADLQELLNRYGDLPSDAPRFLDSRPVRSSVQVTVADEPDPRPTASTEIRELLTGSGDQLAPDLVATEDQPQPVDPNAADGVSERSSGANTGLVVGLVVLALILLAGASFAVARRRA